MAHTDLTVFLSGHVHGSWRDDVRKMAEAKDLPITFKGPCEDHGQSDDVGVDIRGISESDVGPGFYPNLKDDLGGRVNNRRNRIWLAKSDVLIAFFDADHKHYRQWNVASDIGEANRLGVPVIVVHSPVFRHAMKELGARSDVVVNSLEQAVEVLAYVYAD